MRNKDPAPVNSSLSFSRSISWNGLSIPPLTLLARCRENVDMLEAAAADGGRTKEQQVSPDKTSSQDSETLSTTSSASCSRALILHRQGKDLSSDPWH